MNVKVNYYFISFRYALLRTMNRIVTIQYTSISKSSRIRCSHQHYRIVAIATTRRLIANVPQQIPKRDVTATRARRSY